MVLYNGKNCIKFQAKHKILGLGSCWKYIDVVSFRLGLVQETMGSMSKKLVSPETAQ